MIRIAAIIALAASPASAEAPSPFRNTSTPPPVRYQRDVDVRVVTMPAIQLNAFCEKALGLRSAIGWAACTIKGVIYMPSPCPGEDATARLLCHEAAHINGWPATHGE